MKTLISLLLIVFLLIPVGCKAENWLTCQLAGGQWIENECVYPRTIVAPGYYEIEELEEAEIQDAIFTLGVDSYNGVLAQYEDISLEIKEPIRFTQAVDVMIVLYLKDYPMLWLNQDMKLTFCPSRAFTNVTNIPAVTILEPTLVSDILGEYKGWIGVGIELAHDCFYRDYIYWVYVAND